MPRYLDRHDFTSATAADAAEAHRADVAVQDRYGVRYLSYWFDYERQHAFCLVDAPSAAAAEAVHRNAHGMVAHEIIEVRPEEVDAFLGPAPHAPVGEPYTASAFRTILFTDIVGSTAATQALGDDAVMAMLRRHDAAVRAALDTHGGQEVKHTGDGIMASFVSASAGVAAAVEIQRELERQRSAAEPGDPHALRVRIGISAGEPVRDDRDLFGAAVQLAARLCAAAEPDGILVSIAVRELCAGKSIGFSGLRELSLPGFPEPVGAYGVAWRRPRPDGASPSVPVD